MRLRIAHTTSYRYEPQASGVIQILRMTPGNHDGQYVAEWQIDVSTDSRLAQHQDAFGNVTHVLTHGPIADLTINVEGLIETHDTGGVLRGTDERFPPGLFLRSTSLTEVNPAMATFVRELRSESGDDVLGFLHALIGDHLPAPHRHLLGVRPRELDRGALGLDLALQGIKPGLVRLEFRAGPVKFLRRVCELLEKPELLWFYA